MPNPRVSMPERDLADILVCMAQKKPLLVEGALKEGSGHPFGVPVLITPHDKGGFVVLLDNDVTIYLNPRFL